MEGKKSIIKASQIKSEDIHVETVHLGKRRFGDKVFKGVDPEGKVELSGITPAEESGTPAHERCGDDVEVEKSYDEDGALTSIRLTCKCGEVIELEFTQE